MSTHRIKLKLKHLQWRLLANDLKVVMQAAPVNDFELESLVIAELYLSKMKFFEVEPYGSKEINLTLTQVQAYAINGLLGRISREYNQFIRISLEPKLIPGSTKFTVLR